MIGGVWSMNSLMKHYNCSVCAFSNFDYSDHFYPPVTDSSQKIFVKFT